MKKSSKLSLTKKRSAGSTRRVTRSSVGDKKVSNLLMEKEILEFCLDEVIKIEYNFFYSGETCFIVS